jgi:hypothetical protein
MKRKERSLAKRTGVKLNMDIVTALSDVTNTSAIVPEGNSTFTSVFETINQGLAALSDPDNIGNMPPAIKAVASMVMDFVAASVDQDAVYDTCQSEDYDDCFKSFLMSTENSVVSAKLEAVVLPSPSPSPSPTPSPSRTSSATMSSSYVPSPPRSPSPSPLLPLPQKRGSNNAKTAGIATGVIAAVLILFVVAIIALKQRRARKATEKYNGSKLVTRGDSPDKPSEVAKKEHTTVFVREEPSLRGSSSAAPFSVENPLRGGPKPGNFFLQQNANSFSSPAHQKNANALLASFDPVATRRPFQKPR